MSFQSRSRTASVAGCRAGHERRRVSLAPMALDKVCVLLYADVQTGNKTNGAALAE